MHGKAAEVTQSSLLKLSLIRHAPRAWGARLVEDQPQQRLWYSQSGQRAIPQRGTL